ncbi:MAG: response regulator transcription factor [Ferruginibacter sp.]|nr:response regulator transcription factor [Ferruginibacter sp.]
MEKINILLVDDHRIMLDGIESMLQHSDYNILALCGNGEEAWTWLCEHKDVVHIVITDISMPLMNGIELCKKIKSQFPRIYVLMLSMYNSAAAIDEVLNAEADGFILKNASKIEFMNALHKIQNGGTYFSQEIIPFLYKQIIAERKKDSALAVLTEREKEILEMIAQEFTSDEIASKLFISKKTVDNHRTNMLHKTNSKSTIGLVKFAIRNGIITS